MPITVKQLMRVDWEPYFEYEENKPPCKFRVFINKLAPKLTLVHVHRPDGGIVSQYRVGWKKYSSLADAVREYNAAEARLAALARSTKAAGRRA
jgi:hypothetical protein